MYVAMNVDQFHPPSPCPLPSEGSVLVFEDAHLLVVNKPPELLAVPGRGPDKQDCQLHRVQATCPEALLVHRLDQATSGLMLFAKSAAVQRAVSRLFEAREVHKQYIALVHGQMAQDEGVVKLPLIADWPRRPRQKVDFELGKPSETRWKVLSRDTQANTTRVALEPVTGRSHQLRVHMLALGHVLVGDRLYGDSDTSHEASGAHANAVGRMCLHATRIGFKHPVSGVDIQLFCPPEF